MHVHTKYSERPSEWLLQKIGTSESYTDPFYLYNTAINKRGMDLVVITDHNRIDGALQLEKKYPDRVIVGVESTTYFPENGCKIHLLLYDIREEQFRKIQQIRDNIYNLRDYIKEENIAHSVAHATFNINNRLTIDEIKKLILLFDNFEVINGGRNPLNNMVLKDILDNLTPSDINNLSKKYDIMPFSENSWIKGYTGGSDDHAGIFIGKTYTVSKEAVDKKTFIEALKNKKTYAEGRENNFEGFAFTIYKVAYEFAKSKSTYFAKSALSEFTEYIFEKERLSFFDKMRLRKFRHSLRKNDNSFTRSFIEIIDDLDKIHTLDIDEKIDYLYDKVALIVDQYMASVLKSIDTDLKNFNLVDIVKTLSSSFPGILLATPFLSSFKFMYQDRTLLNKLQKSFNKNIDKKSEKKILWFTDTLVDLNGVSTTLRTIANKANKENYNLLLFASLKKGESNEILPKNVKIIKPIYDFTLPYYKSLIIKVPSLLNVLKEVYRYNPTEIYISTPGPMGFIGIMMAKLLNIPSINIYHTDFAEEVDKITDDKHIVRIVDSYMKWFYNLSSNLLVPTYEYINILKERGYNTENIGIFRRGVDLKKFSFAKIKKDYKQDQIQLLYSGRISKDKNLEFLFKVVSKLESKTKYDFVLYIAGDGPDFEEYKNKYASKKIKFLGRLLHSEINNIYSNSHIFLFPSTTDTFGMAVLEAQASGLPALVSKVGGPKEIIKENVTGYALDIDINLWVTELSKLMLLIRENPFAYNNMRYASRKQVEERYNLDNVIKYLFQLDNESVHKSSSFVFSGLKEIANGLLVS